jgi:hypothetical protein
MEEDTRQDFIGKGEKLFEPARTKDSRCRNLYPSSVHFTNGPQRAETRSAWTIYDVGEFTSATRVVLILSKALLGDKDHESLYTGYRNIHPFHIPDARVQGVFKHQFLTRVEENP